MAYLCERSYETLRQYKQYEELYFDYASYKETDKKCNSVTVLLKNGSQIEQQTAFCRGRPAVVKSNAAIQENDFTGVKIFALSLYSVFIFHSRMNNEDDHVLKDWFHKSDPRFSVDLPEMIDDTRLIPEILFQKNLPTSFSNAKDWYSDFQKAVLSKK